MQQIIISTHKSALGINVRRVYLEVVTALFEKLFLSSKYFASVNSGVPSSVGLLVRLLKLLFPETKCREDPRGILSPTTMTRNCNLSTFLQKSETKRDNNLKPILFQRELKIIQVLIEPNFEKYLVGAFCFGILLSNCCLFRRTGDV